MANLDREVVELLEQVRNRVGANGAAVSQLIEIANAIIRTNVLIANLQALPDLLTQTNAILTEILAQLTPEQAAALNLGGGRVVDKPAPVAAP